MMRLNADSKERQTRELLAGSDAGLGVNGGELGKSARPRPSAFDVWVQGQYQSFSDGRNRADSDGHFGVFYLGADYVLSRWLLVGALVQADSMQQRSVTQAFDVKGHGWMAGPYATLRLSNNLFLQGRAAWGRSSNEVSPFLTYTDSFETTRWLATASLIGRWHFGGLQVRPSATISFIEDKSEAYVDSLGIAIPGVTLYLGQLKAGPQLSYRHQMADGSSLEPYLGLEAIWNFAASDKVPDFGGTLTGPEELRGRVELGLKSQLPSGIALDLSGSYDGVGSSIFHAIGGKATLRVPLN
jgi:outer membrane autotransporter protein